MATNKELDENFIVQQKERLDSLREELLRVLRGAEVVNRALQKVEDGTYGLSDISGEPIPRGRLEAVPEAIRTVEEQQRFEQERRPPV